MVVLCRKSLAVCVVCHIRFTWVCMLVFVFADFGCWKAE